MSKKIKDLGYQEFKELVLFLKKDDDTFFPVLTRVSRFIPHITLEQMVILGNVVDSIIKSEDAEEAWARFQVLYGDAELDISGKAQAASISYSDITLSTLEMSYMTALDHANTKGKKMVSKQIINARTLEPLGKIEKLTGAAVLYFKKDPETLALSREEYETTKDELNSLLGNHIALDKVLEYIYHKKKETVRYFVEHFCLRVHCCFKDKELVNQANSEFIEQLKKVSI